MNDFGLLRDKERLDRVVAMDVGAYAGCSYPNGGHADLLLYAKYITLWLLWDDFVIETGGGNGEIIYRIFSLRETPDMADPYMRAWWSVVSDLRQRNGSQEYLECLARSMQTWFDAAVMERASAWHAVMGDFGTYFDRRLMTIGMVQTALLLQVFAGVRVADSGETREMVRDSCKIVGMANEVVSFHKDSEWINLINVYSNIHGCETDKARAAIIRIHNESVISLDSRVRNCSGNVRIWGEALQYCAEGFSYWHTLCPRYASSHTTAIILASS
ncbi:hypothetical protein CIC12_30955 [Burkholderia sp. SG-MS1]|nr:hypothetical protein [Paraburkholderia sp. SG-MS1]